MAGGGAPHCMYEGLEDLPAVMANGMAQSLPRGSGSGSGRSSSSSPVRRVQHGCWGQLEQPLAAALGGARRTDWRGATVVLCGLLLLLLAARHPGARYVTGETLRGALRLPPLRLDAHFFRNSAASGGLCRVEYSVRTYDGALAPACDPGVCRGRERLRLLSDMPPRRRWTHYDEAAYLARFSSGNISGWLQPPQVAYVKQLTAKQHSLGIYGAVGEIGVHHGKFFLPIVGNALAEEPAVAIDLFEEQQGINVDGSGRGSRSFLLANMEACGVPEASVTLMAGNSLMLHADNFSAAGLPLFRMLSVDGGHTLQITLHDLMLASCLVRDGGLVVLDDFPNPTWIGVTEALAHFTNAQDRLVPFMHGYNKVWFTTASHVKLYSDFVAADSATFACTRLHESRRALAGHVVCYSGPFT